ncbi:hypothetical protein ATN88_08135 [Enterovibrio coralii]|uniref:Uncharacterized protein n=1 Tax=Enterovibrio coralii TaxID=294935 RepID=A0A135I5D6_9GAMM|nr:hypothetical protein ATN88_08135 [Enterovibrio coralii]
MKQRKQTQNQMAAASAAILVIQIKYTMADRRPINPNVNVPKPGGGEQPRDRNNDGKLRK